MNTPLLTNQNYERMVAVHGNSCVEVESSSLQALYTPLKRVFLRSAFERIYGAFTRHFCAPFPVTGLSTCKRLTISFESVWCGLTLQADSMKTTRASKFQLSINKDGYVHATSMCQAAGKNLANYKRNKDTKAFLASLAADMRIRISDLVQVRQGDSKTVKQGTWVHPLVAINLGQWCSAEFAVKVAKLVFEWQGRQGRIAPPMAKVQASQPLELPHLDVALISPAQLTELDFTIALAVENSYPACQTVRDISFYHAEICTKFSIPHYSRLKEADYAACVHFIDAYGTQFTPPTQIILRAFDHLNPRDLTNLQRAERSLFEACSTIMNIHRVHPLRNGGEG